MTRQTGFTLIELMVTVVIIGILSAIAVPSYGKYVLRTKLTDAYSGLAGVQPLAEQHWANNRTFEEFSGVPAATDSFSFAVASASATAYTVTATGRSAAAGFVFTIDQNGRRATTAVPAGWTTSDSCWVRDKGAVCSQ
ncbi:MAG: prepilin-type cleavage/methylation protein [Massilia sp.]|nr:prepilin-type cleavage/methylation protein [Massilia sp.]